MATMPSGGPYRLTFVPGTLWIFPSPTLGTTELEVNTNAMSVAVPRLSMEQNMTHTTVNGSMIPKVDGGKIQWRVGENGTLKHNASILMFSMAYSQI